jgi:RNA polymerase sigma-70 factor (ECF subfamily)
VESVISQREKSLIDEFLKGNRRAFEELVRPYVDRVYNALFRMTGSTDDAAELLQETMIKAFRGLANFQGDSSFYTWFFRIALNLALSKRRRRKLGGREVSIESGAPGGHELADYRSEGGPDHAMIRAEQRVMVQKGLNAVGAEHRAILILKDIEGLKYEEIAAVLEIPIGTVRSRLHRARLELAQFLQPMFENGSI